ANLCFDRLLFTYHLNISYRVIPLSSLRLISLFTVSNNPFEFGLVSNVASSASLIPSNSCLFKSTTSFFISLTSYIFVMYVYYVFLCYFYFLYYYLFLYFSYYNYCYSLFFLNTHYSMFLLPSLPFNYLN